MNTFKQGQVLSFVEVAEYLLTKGSLKGIEVFVESTFPNLYQGYWTSDKLPDDNISPNKKYRVKVDSEKTCSVNDIAVAPLCKTSQKELSLSKRMFYYIDMSMPDWVAWTVFDAHKQNWNLYDQGVWFNYEDALLFANALKTALGVK